MKDLYGSLPEQLEAWFKEKNEKPYRASQLLDWLYKKRVATIEAMTTFSAALRGELKKNFSIQALSLERMVKSEEGDTIKFLWKLHDGKLVESVLIYAPDRRTVCVSSQVGCPARCSFCASGKKGLIRNLSTAEIVEQVVQIDRWLQEESGEKVSHLVFMGMGEPLENYEAVVTALKLLTDPFCYGFSGRRITVSTVGIVENIYRLSEEEGVKVNLALSLHAPNQTLRQRIIPFARRYALEDILKATLTYAEKTRRDLTYEYTLIAEINDDLEHAKELAKLLKGHPCTINLIPYNRVDGIHFKRPEKEKIIAFREYLCAYFPTTWRYTKGKDIAAACGQLALEKEIDQKSANEDKKSLVTLNC